MADVAEYSMGFRRLTGERGHLMRPGGHRVMVDGTINALDIGLRKPGSDGELALVSYIYRGWTGWIKASRIQEVKNAVT